MKDRKTNQFVSKGGFYISLIPGTVLGLWLLRYLIGDNLQSGGSHMNGSAYETGSSWTQHLHGLKLLRSGIPFAQDMLDLTAHKQFQYVSSFSKQFVQTFENTLKNYSWSKDPFMTWSRQWEYTYVWNSVREISTVYPHAMTLLDVGSGVTFFDYLLAKSLPGSHVVASDLDSSYPPLFKELNAAQTDGNPVIFYLHDARGAMQFPENSFDVVFCVSVLEHTDMYEDIVADIFRVLRPGGFFVLTFDIATKRDGTIGLQPERAVKLLKYIESFFTEISPPDYTYDESSIACKARGECGEIMDVKWVNGHFKDIAAPVEWLITVSCHTFLKAQGDLTIERQ